MFNLTEFRNNKKDARYGDYLPYFGFIAEGVMLNKDGSLTAGISFSGPDAISSGPQVREHMGMMIEKAIASLDNQWVMHQYSFRVPAKNQPATEDQYFPSPALAVIDKDREMEWSSNTRYVTKQYLFLTYIPPDDKSQGLDSLFSEDTGKRGSSAKAERALSEFYSEVNRFVELLNNAPGAKAEVLSSAKASSVIYKITSGGVHVSESLKLPNPPVYLDALFGNKDVTTGVAPKIGNRFVIPITVMSYPANSFPEILSGLDIMDTEYYICQRFLPLGISASRAKLTKMATSWSTKRYGMRDIMKQTAGGEPSPNRDAIRMEDDAQEGLADLNSGAVSYGYHTFTLVLNGEDDERLAINAKKIASELDKREFAAAIQTIGAWDAFMATIPSMSYADPHRTLISNRNYSDIMLLNSMWPGNSSAPSPFINKDGTAPALSYCVTDGSTPFALNIHQGDLGNTLIAGPSGAGKSTLLCLLQAQFLRYQNARVITIDVGMSSKAMTLMADGEWMEITGARTDKPQFAPLYSLTAEQARDWLADSIFEQGAKMSLGHEQRAMLLTAIRELKSAHEANPNVPMSLNALSGKIQDMDMRNAMSDYISDGAYASLFDGEEPDSMNFEHFMTTIEIQEIMNMGDRAVTPALDYLLMRIDHSLNDGRPTLLVIDEAWLALKNPKLASRVGGWIKTVRKKNTALVLATQNLKDLSDANNAMTSVVLDTSSIPTRILLANEDARLDPDPYKKLGLSNDQIMYVSSMTRKRDYLYLTSGYVRSFTLNLTQLQLAFMGVSSPDDVKRVTALYERGVENNDPLWWTAWLEERGIGNDVIGAMNSWLKSIVSDVE